MCVLPIGVGFLPHYSYGGSVPQVASFLDARAISALEKDVASLPMASQFRGVYFPHDRVGIMRTMSFNLLDE